MAAIIVYHFVLIIVFIANLEYAKNAKMAIS